MIFVSVGTNTKPFNRLIEGVDRVANEIDEEIMIQTGHSTYIPEKCKYFKFCDNKDMLSHIQNASVIIAHTGFGVIGDSIKYNKPMILVPRELKYSEAVDKQYELAEYLADQHESIICVRDMSLLLGAIDIIRTVTVHYDYRTKIPDLIDDFIAQNLVGKD